MSELSREQVEASDAAVEARGEVLIALMQGGFAADAGRIRALVMPVVYRILTERAAMLAEARAQVVRDVEGWAEANIGGVSPRLSVALARHMPAAVREGGTERRTAPGGSDGPAESECPSDGRTGPHPVPEPCSACGWQYDEATLDAARRGQIRLDFNPTHYCRPDLTCGHRLGVMRCQLRRGHDGGHEDWRGVAQERRA